MRLTCFMQVSRAAALAAALALSSCFSPWPVTGPYRCSEGGSCPQGFTCDDGVCCVPSGTPACPTLVPASGVCADGAPPRPWYPDSDGDGFGNRAGALAACAQPFLTAHVTNADDCDDTSALARPGGTEACDGVDNNCNGEVDEGFLPQKTVFPDQDKDGAGDPAAPLAICAAAARLPSGYTDNNGDCAPTDATRFPGQVEFCNGLDDDCDGRADEEPVEGSGQACMTGQRGLCAPGSIACVAAKKECLSTYTPTSDSCDGVDNDCDGEVDERPDCGGPVSFLAPPPGVRVGARDLGKGLTFGELTTSCLKAFPGSSEAAWLNPNWVGPGPNHQLLYVEAAPGTVWDLSKPGTRVNLLGGWVITAPAPDAGANGPWDESSMPVMYLCGEEDSRFLRYVHVPDSLMTSTRGALTVSVPVAGEPSPGFIFGSTTNAPDVKRIKRLEFVVKLKPKALNPQPTFTLTLSPDAGVQVQ